MVFESKDAIEFGNGLTCMVNVLDVSIGTVNQLALFWSFGHLAIWPHELIKMTNSWS